MSVRNINAAAGAMSGVASPAEVSSSPRQTGHVSWYKELKSYGYIIPDNGGPAIFVHVSAVERAGLRTLPEGARISFDTLNVRPDRTIAVNLQLH